jgi:hypothetical protein
MSLVDPTADNESAIEKPPSTDNVAPIAALPTNTTNPSATIAVKRVFSLNDVKRVVQVDVTWDLYPDYEPWVFKFRLMLSKEMQAKREEWLALPQAEAASPEKWRKEILDEICDTLVDIPAGFGDITNAVLDPGTVWRNYVERINDPEQKETLYKIMETANNGYWAKVSPRIFRTKV